MRRRNEDEKKEKIKCNILVGHKCFMDDNDIEFEEVKMILYKTFNRISSLYGLEVTFEALNWIVDKIKEEEK